MTERDSKGRFKKGHSGNPDGRKKAHRPYIEVMFESVDAVDWQEIIEQAIRQAKRGDKDARKWLADYIMGLPKQKVAFEGSGEMRIVVEYIRTKG